MLQPFSRSAETLKLKEFSVGERIKWLAVFCSCSLLSCSSSSRALARICTEYRALAVDVVGEGAERPDTGEVTVPAGSCRSTIARLTRPGCVRRRYGYRNDDVERSETSRSARPHLNYHRIALSSSFTMRVVASGFGRRQFLAALSTAAISCRPPLPALADEMDPFNGRDRSKSPILLQQDYYCKL